MAIVATDSPRISQVVKYEFEPSIGFCRRAVTAYEAADSTYTVGTVLGKTLTSGAAVAVAGGTNTGNGAMGSITVGATAKPGVYTLRITAASSNAGAFSLFAANGDLIGTGNVASAFVGGGLSFTLADGSTDFAVGDTFTIVVTGTEKFKICKYTAIDGSNIPAAIYIGSAAAGFGTATVSATTDTTVIVLERGPVVIAKESLVLDSSFDSAAKKTGLYTRLEQLGIICEAQL